METLIFLLLVGAVVGYWTSAMRAREFALRAARRACEREGVQLLDETVEVIRVRPARDAAGRACWRRHYRFEFSDDGGNRRGGGLELVGAHPVALHLDLAPYTLHELH